jgi:hypothetical protein
MHKFAFAAPIVGLAALILGVVAVPAALADTITAEDEGGGTIRLHDSSGNSAYPYDYGGGEYTGHTSDGTQLRLNDEGGGSYRLSDSNGNSTYLYGS